jgi:hypothetical protein
MLTDGLGDEHEVKGEDAKNEFRGSGMWMCAPLSGLTRDGVCAD